MKKQTDLLKVVAFGSGMVICATTFLLPASAQSTTPTATTTPTVTGTAKPVPTKRANETAAQKCERIKAVVAERKDNLINKTEAMPTMMSGLVKKYEDTAKKLKAEGYDTVQLEANIAKLKLVIEQRSSLRKTNATTALDKVQAIQCATTPSFKTPEGKTINRRDPNAIKAYITDVFKVAKDSYIAKKDQFQTDVKEALKAVMAEMKAMRLERKAKRGQTDSEGATPKATKAVQATRKPENGTPKPSGTIRPTKTDKPTNTLKPTVSTGAQAVE